MTLSCARSATEKREFSGLPVHWAHWSYIFAEGAFLVVSVTDESARLLRGTVDRGAVEHKTGLLGRFCRYGLESDLLRHL